jgi:predicted RNase H-like HicB family nuclease
MRFREIGDKTMRFEGRVWKDKGSKYWLVEVPLLDVMTQGTSKDEAYFMIADTIECLINKKGFKVDVRPVDSGSFTVGASNESAMIALMLKRQREAHRLTLAEVARRLGQKSPNAYARYEQGKSLPTVEKLNKAMKAINPEFEPILKVA